MKILLLTNVSINNPFTSHIKGSEIDTEDAIASELIEKGYATEVKKATRKKTTKSTDATATTDSES